MDPMSLSSLMSAGSSLLKSLSGPSGQNSQPKGPQRADGYAIGGMVESDSPNWMSSGATGGATGGAYGGAYSQANIDGSNWNVATGHGSAIGNGKSGGNGGLSPIQQTSQGGVSPASPFAVPGTQPLATNGGSAITLVLAAAVAYLLFKKG